MEKFVGGQGLISFKSSDCHKISFFNDGGLKLGHFDIFDMLFAFLAFRPAKFVILHMGLGLYIFMSVNVTGPEPNNSGLSMIIATFFVDHNPIRHNDEGSW